MENPLTIARIGEILEGLATDGLYWANNEYDKKRYQRILELAYQLGTEPVGSTDPVPRVPVTPKIGVDGAVFNQEGDILLIRRKDTRLWAMPGGAVEIGESPSVAVVREVQEETGVIMKPLSVVGVFDNWMDRRELAHHLYHVVIRGFLAGGGIRIQESEILEASWCNPTELPDSMAFHPGHYGRVVHAVGGAIGVFD